MKGVFEKKELRIMARHVHGFRGFPPMFHAHCELVYVISGTIHTVIDDVPRALSAGELSITFPYSIHSYEPSEDAEAIIVLFSPEAAGAFQKKLLSYKPQLPYLEYAGDFLPLLQKICSYTSSKDQDCENIANAYLEALTGELLLSMDLVSMEDTDLNTTQKILIYCSEHFKEDISVHQVSSTLYVSESAITKIFSSKLKCSFREYINMLRISKVKNLLEHTDKKIVDIMLECGFSNQSSFNRIFIGDCGQTPKAYRDSHRVSQ